MKEFIKEYINTFKQAKPLHKILYFLPTISLTIAFIFVILLYLESSKDLYYMYKYKHITFIYFIVWIIASIFMLAGAFFGLQDLIDFFKDMIIPKNLKESLLNSIIGFLVIIITSIFFMMFAVGIPYSIVEHWNISKIILLILLFGLIFFGIYIFIISNDEDTIGRYVFTTILLGVFVLYPFSRSDTYNQFMAEYYLENKDYDSAIDYLKFLALESDDNYIREKSANLVINLYLKDDHKGSAVNFAHKVNDISDYANYIIGMDELESENLTSATYYLYRASDSYAYKDAYNELQEAIKERGRKLLHDIFIPDDIFDLIPTKKIFKGAKILKRISKGSNIGKTIYKNRMKRSINISKEKNKRV